MRKKHIRRCLTVLILICLDQFSKLLVKAFVPATSLNSIIYTHSDTGWFMFHLHPELHNRYSLPIDIVIAVFAIAFVISLIVYLKYERPALLRDIPDSDVVKSSPRLSETALVLSIAGIICSTLFDAFIWGGSLDFLCIEWAKFYTDTVEPYTINYRYDIDLKDIFLNIGLVLILIRSVRFKISQYKLPKSSRKLISKRELHIIRSIREAVVETTEQVEPSENGEKKNSVFDIITIVFFAIFFSAGLGFLLYILAVLVIIPVAVEISPALDALLTKIGDENDTEEIYNTIHSICLLIAVLPGICVANTAVKYRERHFIHDTNGMIVTLDGLRYHLRQHFWYDAISVIGIVILCLILHIYGPWYISPFGILYDFLGIPLGLILSAAITVIAQIFGIIYAQKSWRAEFFYGE